MFTACALTAYLLVRIPSHFKNSVGKGAASTPNWYRLMKNMTAHLCLLELCGIASKQPDSVILFYRMTDIR